MASSAVGTETLLRLYTPSSHELARTTLEAADAFIRGDQRTAIALLERSRPARLGAVAGERRRNGPS